MKRSAAIVFLLLAVGGMGTKAVATQAQPVPVPEEQSSGPQIDIAGTAIGTGTFGNGSGNGKAGINFNDSAIQVGAAQRLYRGGAVGSFVIGELATDDTVSGLGNPFFLHQAFADYQSESFEALIGRSDSPNAHLVDFPTLRGDDLIVFTNPLNPFSNGRNIEEHRYANVGSLTFNQGLKYYENVHVQHFINSAGVGAPDGVNAAGLSFQYLGSPGLEVFETFPSWGIGYEYFNVPNNAASGLHQIYAGGVLNLNASVIDHWDLRVQEILNLGSELSVFSGITDTFQAASNSVAASLRFLHSPFGTPGYQLALTAGYRNYFKVSSSRSLGWALTAVKRLGQGFDLVVQYQGQWRDSALAVAQSSGQSYEHIAEIGLVFNFDTVFNEQISPRRSLLNQNHQYLPN